MSTDECARRLDQARAQPPIDALIFPVGEHTRTIRYAPQGDKKDWEIGEPYIPRSLIPTKGTPLLIHIEWDLDTKGEFFGVPTYRENSAL